MYMYFSEGQSPFYILFHKELFSASVKTWFSILWWCKKGEREGKGQYGTDILMSDKITIARRHARNRARGCIESATYLSSLAACDSHRSHFSAEGNRITGIFSAAINSHSSFSLHPARHRNRLRVSFMDPRCSVEGTPPQRSPFVLFERRGRRRRGGRGCTSNTGYDLTNVPGQKPPSVTGPDRATSRSPSWRNIKRAAALRRRWRFFKFSLPRSIGTRVVLFLPPASAKSTLSSITDENEGKIH